MKRTIIIHWFKDTITLLKESIKSIENISGLGMIHIPVDRNPLHNQKSYSERFRIIE